MGQAPTQILFFGGEFFVFFCVFCVVFMFPIVSKKIKIWIGWWVSDQSEFFSDFWIFFNLTRPLSVLGLLRLVFHWALQMYRFQSQIKQTLSSISVIKFLNIQVIFFFFWSRQMLQQFELQFYKLHAYMYVPFQRTDRYFLQKKTQNR